VDNDTPDGLGMDTSICYAVAPLTLQVNPQPVFDLEDSYILCVDTNGSEVLNAPVLNTGLTAPTYSFIWFLNGVEITGATSGSYMPTEGGTYSVSVTDVSTSVNTMCESSDSTEVIESAPPVVTATVTTDAFADTHVIEVSVNGPGEYEYSLDGGPWQDEPIFVDVSLGEHVVTARDKNGCGEASDEVIVMDYPVFFTPNGDGYHDTWNISAINNQPNAKIYIFDRYGKLLKQLSPTGAGWNGTYNGNPMPTSDYWFVVEYNEPNTGDRKEFKAHFTLKR
jgi:gliding motility-associated-like protein